MSCHLKLVLIWLDIQIVHISHISSLYRFPSPPWSQSQLLHATLWSLWIMSMRTWMETLLCEHRFLVLLLWHWQSMNRLQDQSRSDTSLVSILFQLWVSHLKTQFLTNSMQFCDWLDLCHQTSHVCSFTRSLQLGIATCVPKIHNAK